MLPEADLLAKRAALGWLVQHHPEWTHQDLADALSMSRSWVSKWLQRKRQADPADVLALHSRSRARHTPPASIASQPAVVQRILEIRMAPPEHLQRVPGPEAILYYLHRDLALQQADVRLPRSQTTIWKILRQAGCLEKDRRRKSKPLELRQPGEEVQFDLKDASSVPAEQEGKRQHVVEIANARRCWHFHLVAPAGEWCFRCRNSTGSGGPVFAPAGLAPDGGHDIFSYHFPR
jgi:hypothetical protein